MIRDAASAANKSSFRLSHAHRTPPPCWAICLAYARSCHQDARWRNILLHITNSDWWLVFSTIEPVDTVDGVGLVRVLQEISSPIGDTCFTKLLPLILLIYSASRFAFLHHTAYRHHRTASSSDMKIMN